MAVVYKAVQEPLERVVAIKALKPSIAIDSQFAKRFEREAQFVAGLAHENILHVLDFVKDGQSMYIVMEHIEGVDLAALLEKSPVLPVDVAVIIALQVARALDYAHFRGIVHRDIKPANVMISQAGEVKLMDFGIAREEASLDPTESTAGIGSPSYMSPEQILGDKLDARSDIFSLGIVLYQMLTGKKPFVEDDARTVMQKIRLDRYTSARKINSAVPRRVEHILTRAMQKLPANRYPTTQGLIDDLMEFLAPRVSGNYNARLVAYLRDVGVVSGAKADEILSAGVHRVGRNTRYRDQPLLLQIGVVEAAIGLLVAGSGALLQRAAGRFETRPENMRAAAPIEQKPEGYLHVVVDPWANVLVDGRLLLTTPSARPIALSPGVHFLRFENPYFETVDREVQIKRGASVVVDVALQEKRAVANDGGVK